MSLFKTPLQPSARTVIPAPAKANIAVQLSDASYISKMLNCVRCLDDHGVKEHIHFIVAALLDRETFLKLTRPVANEPFAQLLADRPRYVSVLTSPYMDSRWSSADRVDRLIEHASSLQGPLTKYGFPVSQSLHLLDLDEFAIPGYAIVLDKPMWFGYEGLITLNLFKDRFRFFSVTFSFYSGDADSGLIIGGIQGRRTDHILDQYREFTKLAHGLRPRDFLLEVLRSIARIENLDHVLGVPDRFRYHRHRYFAGSDRSDLHLDYDDIWKDRGGALNDDGLYELPLTADRDLARIAAKKRSMYRRRYDLLDRLEMRLACELQAAVPVAAIRAA